MNFLSPDCVPLLESFALFGHLFCNFAAGRCNLPLLNNKTAPFVVKISIKGYFHPHALIAGAQGEVS